MEDSNVTESLAPTELHKQLVFYKANFWFHLPFPIAMICLYLYLKFNGLHRRLVHFKPFHILMYFSFPMMFINFFNYYEWQMSTLGLIRGFSIFFGKIVAPMFQFSYHFANILLLYGDCSEWWQVFDDRWPRWFAYFPFVVIVGTFQMCMAPAGWSDFKIWLYAYSYHVHEAFITLVNLLLWLFWWVKSEKMQSLTVIKVCYLVNVMVYIVMSGFMILLKMLNNYSDHHQDPFDEHYELQFYYLPFVWVIASLIAGQPEVQRIFQKKNPDAPTQFQMSYITVQ